MKRSNAHVLATRGSVPCEHRTAVQHTLIPALRVQAPEAASLIAGLSKDADPTTSDFESLEQR